MSSYEVAVRKLAGEVGATWLRLGRWVAKRQEEVVSDVAALVGLGLLGFGVHEIYPPACWIVVGVLVLAWALGPSRGGSQL